MYNLINKIIHSWLDHLEIYGTFKYEKDVFDTLDFDNTNYSELEDYVITKLHTDHKFQYQITFTKNNYTLFNYIKWNPKANIPTKDYIIIYSTAFKLLTDEEILYFLEWYFNLNNCRRFDICLDIKENITKLLWFFRTVKQKGGEIYDTNWDVATKYIWEIQNTKNKRTLIRIYNKILDILAKKKIKLYQDYLYEDDVTRVELEVRQELAKNINYKDVFNKVVLKAIFKNYLRKHTDIFNQLEWKQFSLYRKPLTKLDPEEYQGLYYRTQKKNMFLWHAKTIYNLWFCPIRVLAWEWLYQEKTKLAFWWELMEMIQEREKILEQSAKERRFIRREEKFLSSNNDKNDS